MADARAPRRPEHRPYRLLVVGLYLFLSIAFSLGVTVSVVSSVLERRALEAPAREDAELPSLETSEGCIAEAARLARALEARRVAFADPGDGGSPSPEARWTHFRDVWRAELARARTLCVADAAPASSARLAPLLGRLERLAEAYDTDAAQLQAALGPELGAFRQALREAQGELVPAAPPAPR